MPEAARAMLAGCSHLSPHTSGCGTDSDPHCWPLFSVFRLRLLSSFAYFNPLKLEKLFNKFPASLELVDVGQLDTLIRHWFKHR